MPDKVSPGDKYADMAVCMDHIYCIDKDNKHGMLMTSTQVDEEAQHFYRELGYKDCGGFVVDVPGYEQPMEMIMIKVV